MDGVIVDSNPVHTQAWNEYLGRFGIVIDGIEERMSGRRNDEIVGDFFGGSLTAAEIAGHGAAKERLYRELMEAEIQARLVPGVVPFVRQVAGGPVGVATNAEPKNVTFVLDAAGLGGCFRAVVDGHQVEWPKPHPEIYLKTAALLDTAPSDCIVFEDSLAGIAAARAAGARVVGITTTHSSLPDADFVTPDFENPELLRWLSIQHKCV